MFYKFVRKFLNNKYSTKEKKFGPEKQVIFVRFPFISKQINHLLDSELKRTLSRYLPQIDLKLAIYNNYKLKSFFTVKEKLPASLSSSTVYLFSCSKCSLEYVGSTIKNLTLRVDEHRGISSRTGLHLVRPLNSSIRNHSVNTCDTNIKLEDFKILTKAINLEELRIYESIIIKMKKPALNIDVSACPLYVF